MSRTTITSLLLFALLACEPPPEGRVAEAGVFTTVGAPRSWRLESPPADTIQTVTRRVWYGDYADFMGSVSAEGTEIAYHNWDGGDLEIRDLVTGAIQNLTNNPAPYVPGFGMYPCLSRDGEQVAYGWWESSNPYYWQLRVVDRGTSEHRTLIPAETFIYPMDWSPDGEQIAAVIARHDGSSRIALVSAEDGSVRVLKELDRWQPLNMRYSPDGEALLYDLPSDREREDSRDIFLLPLDGGAERALVSHPANDVLFGWSPDGDHVLFSSDRTGTPAAWLQPVRIGDAQGPPLLVKPDLWQSVPMGFARDGRFFYGVMAGSRNIRLSTLDLETGDALGPPATASAPSLGDATWPSWSPDGQYLAFLLQATISQNPRTLAIRSMETGMERHLRLPMEVYYPQQTLWMPDGGSILLRSPDLEGRFGLFRTDVFTGETTLLFTKGPMGVGSFDVFPEGDSIVYASEEEHEPGQNRVRILVRDLESGAEREVYRVVLGGVGQVNHVALSPDGETVAFLHRAKRQNEENPDAVLLVPIGGGPARELVAGNFMKIAWMRNGESLLVRAIGDPADLRGGGMKLLRADVESGEVFGTGLAMEGVGHMALSPDGRQLAYADGQRAMEVWAMEGFLPRTEGTAETGNGGQP